MEDLVEAGSTGALPYVYGHVWQLGTADILRLGPYALDSSIASMLHSRSGRLAILGVLST
jgi:hypothetical protein